MEKIRIERASFWKTIAIIFIILFLVETSWVIWSVKEYVEEDRKQKECFYNICSEYVDAAYESDVCYCYDYDVLGDLTIVKTELVT